MTAHAIYSALGGDEGARSEHYRALFCTQIYNGPINDIRLALQQSQPLGGTRFADTIKRMTGQRREVKARGRPRKVKQDEVVGQLLGASIEIRAD